MGVARESIMYVSLTMKSSSIKVFLSQLTGVMEVLSEYMEEFIEGDKKKGKNQGNHRNIVSQSNITIIIGVELVLMGRGSIRERIRRHSRKVN
jgi:hypothetical protein